ncbi:MAG: protein MltB [Deltaproteobacteria bacterium CG1_02_45_11]|nr:MAG: protein MltB [Deltaproteobacteria bacterium CG1_02_45_11]
MFYFRTTFIKYILFFNCLLIIKFILPVQNPAFAEQMGGHFKSLQKRLINDGFDKTGIKELYSPPQVFFDTSSVSLFFVHREDKLNYNQFATIESIKKARKYMQEHEVELAGAERKYGVDKEMITAIILVETKLGTVLGKSSTFNTLSTTASLSEPFLRERVWEKIKSFGGLTKKDFEKKAIIKSEWAYRELKAFIQYTTGEKINPVEVYGSYAGAMGIAQFMPSNILLLARDGNQDGRIDLFNHADAIASIANYLKHYGWHPGIDDKKAYNVLYHYNHSSYYVNTLLLIAERLKG